MSKNREYFVVPYYPSQWDKRRKQFSNPFSNTARIIYATSKEKAVDYASREDGHSWNDRPLHYMVFDMRVAGFFQAEVPNPIITTESKP